MLDSKLNIDSECPLCKGSKPNFIGSKFAGGTDNDYHQCTDCALLYAAVLPSSDTVSEIYQGYYTVKNIKRKRLKLTPIVKYLNRKKKKLNDSRPLRFLDIGSNAGYFTEAARQLGCESFGIDLDEKAVAFAKENYPGSDFRSTTVEKLSETEPPFDLIYCTEVIEHVPDMHAFLKAIHKISNENTLLFFTTPDSGHFKTPKNLISWDEVIPLQHIRLFNKKNLKQLFEQHGFKQKFSFPMLRANQRVFFKIAT